MRDCPVRENRRAGRETGRTHISLEAGRERAQNATLALGSRDPWAFPVFGNRMHTPFSIVLRSDLVLPIRRYGNGSRGLRCGASGVFPFIGIFSPWGGVQRREEVMLGWREPGAFWGLDRGLALWVQRGGRRR